MRTRRVKPIQMLPLPDYGDHMLIADFVAACRSGTFIDYDGYGYYATQTQESDKLIRPSEVMKGHIDWSFSHVMWYNR